MDVKEATRLTRDGGFICGDDLELQASRCDMNFARQAANGDAVSDPYTGETFYPGVTLALHEVFGPVSAYDGFWLMRKSGDNYVDVSLREATAVLPTHWPRKIVEKLRARFSSRQELAGIIV